MQEIKIYDAERKPANWTEVLSDSQVAVFASDAASGGHRNPSGGGSGSSGEQSTCLVFENLDEAVAYCASQQDVPRLRLDIYDKAGKAKEPIRSFIAKEHARRALAGRLKWGIGFLVSGALLVVFDWALDWEWIWPTAVGIKLMMTSVVFLVWWWVRRK
ncbi:MAG: hypothetical protein JWO20_1620 [Candidatus Angelobacter sp.]|jgi:hypothetical protein|nr:hypothetical protein [Candidatus Angelobacter sp.]